MVVAIVAAAALLFAIFIVAAVAGNRAHDRIIEEERDKARHGLECRRNSE